MPTLWRGSLKFKKSEQIQNVVNESLFAGILGRIILFKKSTSSPKKTRRSLALFFWLDGGLLLRLDGGLHLPPFSHAPIGFCRIIFVFTNSTTIIDQIVAFPFVECFFSSDQNISPNIPSPIVVFREPQPMPPSGLLGHNRCIPNMTTDFRIIFLEIHISMEKFFQTKMNTLHTKKSKDKILQG